MDACHKFCRREVPLSRKAAVAVRVSRAVTLAFDPSEQVDGGSGGCGNALSLYVASLGLIIMFPVMVQEMVSLLPW